MGQVGCVGCHIERLTLQVGGFVFIHPRIKFYCLQSHLVNALCGEFFVDHFLVLKLCIIVAGIVFRAHQFL